MSQLPATLQSLLNASPGQLDDAWADFLAEFSTLLLHVARSVSSGRDQAMDAYAHLLDQLRKDHCKKLHGYAIDPNTRFTTWLVVVSRRACVDFHRTRYGRSRPEDSSSSKDRRALRRKLEELTGAPDDLSFVIDESGASPDRRILDHELVSGLQDALDSLAPADRLLLALRFEEDLSASEIAKIMVFPSQFHVYRRLNSVLASMRVALRTRGIESAIS
ncbi:MAG TPA: sigma-70 family RNA polymerase sigma factor [Gemmatimonadaceae bacterium]|nr:sigma-70 family RNA polymerase sigma factor [Gemmatimonadaceae bacterium]